MHSSEFNNLLYKGSDPAQLETLIISINGKSIAHNTLHDDLATLDNIPPYYLWKLLNLNNLYKNPLMGFSSESGLSVYFFYIDNHYVFYAKGEVNKGLYELSLEAIIPRNKELEGGIKHIKYYKIAYKRDKKIMGVGFPQIEKFRGAEGREIRNLQKTKEFIPSDIKDKEFILKLGSTRTAFYSTPMLKFCGFFISEFLGELIKSAEPNEALFPIQLHHNNDAFKGFFWLFEERDIIDFDKSRFDLVLRGRIIDSFDPSEISNTSDLKSKTIELLMEDINKKVIPRFLTIETDHGAFRLKGLNQMIISEKIATLLTEHNISGFELEPSAYIVFVLSRTL